MKKLFIIFLFLILPAVSFSASCDGTALLGLTEDTAPTADDLFYSVNDPSGTPGDRKVTFDSILRPTIQATDPTSSDDSGLYVNSVDGDAFLVSNGIGISTWATTYTPAATPVTFSSAEMTTDSSITLTLSDLSTYTSTFGTFSLIGSVTGTDTLDYVSGNGTDEIVMEPNSLTFSSDDTLTFSYTDASGDWSPAITAFTAESVTNSIPASIVYLINQNFETVTTGYDNGETWAEFETDGTVTIDPAYTTTVLAGTQSCYLASPGYQTASITSPSFTSTDTISHKFIYYVEEFPSSAITIVQYTDGSTTGCLLEQRVDGALAIQHGTIKYYGNTGDIIISTKYYIWVDINNSSGSDDGTLDVFISITDTKPGTPSSSISVGDNTTDFTNITHRVSSSMKCVIDKIEVN